MTGMQSGSAGVLARAALVSIALRDGEQVLWLTPRGWKLINELQMCG
jgi:hypothetical protein